MAGMFDYIFDNINLNKAALRHVNHRLCLQKKTNRNIYIFMALAGFYAANETVKRIKQEEKIAKLQKEIEELKQSEGE